MQLYRVSKGRRCNNLHLHYYFAFTVFACICSFLDPVAFYQYLWSHQCRVSSPFSAQCIPDPINVKCCSCKLQLPIRMYECVTLLNSRAILLEVELKQKHQKRGMLKVSCPPPSIAVLWANITLRRVHATWLHCWLVPALCGGDCACSFLGLSMFKSRGNRIQPTLRGT